MGCCAPSGTRVEDEPREQPPGHAVDAKTEAETPPDSQGLKGATAKSEPERTREPANPLTAAGKHAAGGANDANGVGVHEGNGEGGDGSAAPVEGQPVTPETLDVGGGGSEQHTPVAPPLGSTMTSSQNEPPAQLAAAEAKDAARDEHSEKKDEPKELCRDQTGSRLELLPQASGANLSSSHASNKDDDRPTPQFDERKMRLRRWFDGIAPPPVPINANLSQSEHLALTAENIEKNRYYLQKLARAQHEDQMGTGHSFRAKTPVHSNSARGDAMVASLAAVPSGRIDVRGEGGAGGQFLQNSQSHNMSSGN